MTPERWQQVKGVLQGALELAPDERPAFLDRTCSTDYSLRREVELLIIENEQIGTRFLSTAAIPDEVRFQLSPGTRIGAYEILDEIAHGGMGVVYGAVRADGQYKQRVALKIVRTDLDAELTATRFRNERQILASLDHPNIARILDGGTTADGIPYFVMEFIDSLPITEYCDKRELSIDSRLQIFRTVCSAVHYAHQRLVIHRDLKPSNILITTEGIPKLLDFGIAKILDMSLAAENTTMTGGNLWLMTPEYASPEQVRNETITTATDVYSLGIILYLLLTGRHPYKIKRASPHELMRAICEEDPEKPSTAVSRSRASVTSDDSASAIVPIANSFESKKSRRALAGDLDNIVLKALRKEPGRRYASVEQFSEDIRRHLARLPVIAHQDSLRYRAQKFVSRNRLGVVAVALVILSLLAGFITTLQQARIARSERARAERRFNEVRSLANSLIFDVHDSIQNLPGATAARKLLVTNALRYLDSLAQEASGDFSLQQELATAYERVGDVQGDPSGANLGDTAGALTSYKKALAIRESITGSDRNSGDGQRALVLDYKKIGLSLVAAGDYKNAASYARSALAVQEQIAKESPGPDSSEALAGTYYLVGLTQADLADFASALKSLRRSATIRESITINDRTFQHRVHMRLAGTYGVMGMVLWRIGDENQAISFLHKDLDILKELTGTDRNNALYREYLAEVCFQLGYYLQAQGDGPEALRYLNRALNDARALLAADPAEARAKRLIGRCETYVGFVLVKDGRISQAFKHIREGLGIAEESYREDPAEKADKLTGISDAYEALGFAFSRQAKSPGLTFPARIGDLKQACDAYQKSLDLLNQAKSLGALSGFDSREPGKIAQELARCDAELKKLTTTSMPP